MKRLKPTTASRRNTSVIEYRKVLTASKPEKSLTKGVKRAWGRNNRGRITTRHKGGGHKRLYRDIDFKYDKFEIPFTIKTIEYDPNRSGFIGLVVYKDGEKRYVLLHKEAKVGDTYIVSEKAPLAAGNRLPLKKVTVGTMVYNVELKHKGGAKVARSGGNYAEVQAKDGGYVSLKLPSSEVRQVPENAWATIGEVSNPENRLRNLGKAGRSRWLGIRPTVRGTAMNPVDHPHGGGEGRQGRGRRRAISIYGKPTGKGQKSRKPKKYSNKFITRRRKVGKR
ncbi:MAG: 50S ribosomal protein L2 [bacterium]|nr:50S ribosomal protein L2 [bacterium]